MSNNLSQWTTHFQGKSWFLGIGINQYEHYPSLHNAVKDVEDVLQLLTEQYDVEQDCSLTLFNKHADEAGILTTLEHLAESIGPHDKLLIYYSGHGIIHHSTQLAYWIPVHGKPGVTADLIGNSTIHDHLSAIKARHILLISDSCYSGSLFLKGGTRSARVIESLETTSSRWALCSGRSDEVVADGDPGTNSPFARSLLDTLSENTADALNISRVVERVREQTAASSAQIPEGNPLRLPGHHGGQYVFRRKGTSLPIAASGLESTHETNGTSVRERTSGSRQLGTRTRRIPMWQLGAIGIVIAAMALSIAWLTGLVGGHSAPLEMSCIAMKEHLALDITGGQPDYYVTISRVSEVIHRDTFNETGTLLIPYRDFLPAPGPYEVVITDVGEALQNQTIAIPDPNAISVNAFNTTSGIKTDVLWPIDQARRFTTGQPVYAYLNAFTASPTEVIFGWFDSENRMLFELEVRKIQPESDPVRIVTYRQFRTPGNYLVKIADGNGIKLRETQFVVVQNPN